MTIDTLERLGIEPSLSARTLAAFKQLDLLTKDGNLTETMEKIRVAPTDQLQAVLAEWLREAYKPIFQFVDPSESVGRITDQFRRYEPKGMLNRMVTLFLGLCHQAGMIEKPTMPRTATKKNASAGKFEKSRRTIRRTSRTADSKHEDQDNSGGLGNELSAATKDRYVALLIERAEKADELDPDLLDRIRPRSGSWRLRHEEGLEPGPSCGLGDLWRENLHGPGAPL